MIRNTLRAVFVLGFCDFHPLIGVNYRILRISAAEKFFKYHGKKTLLL